MRTRSSIVFPSVFLWNYLSTMLVCQLNWVKYLELHPTVSPQPATRVPTTYVTFCGLDAVFSQANIGQTEASRAFLVHMKWWKTKSRTSGVCCQPCLLCMIRGYSIQSLILLAKQKNGDTSSLKLRHTYIRVYVRTCTRGSKCCHF